MGVSPAYSIHEYRPDIYKVVAFKGWRDPDAVRLKDPEKVQHYDFKLDCNYSRARNMVLQYALCNQWDWFFTGTLDEKKYNRYNLDRFQKDLTQWIRDKRKAYGTQVQYLLIPEHHADGAWHIHGMISGLPEDKIRRFRWPEPKDLINSSFMNWPDYMNKFGFCSLGPIRDSVGTAFYLTKYISKDLSRRGGDLGKHLYFHSRPLRKAEKASDVYLYHQELEDLCINDYDFCKVGMIQDAHWSFPYVWAGSEYECSSLDPKSMPDPLQTFDPKTIEPTYEQMKIVL